MTVSNNNNKWQINTKRKIEFFVNPISLEILKKTLEMKYLSGPAIEIFEIL